MTRRVARRSFAGRWDLVSLGRRRQALGGRLRWFAGLARRAGAPGRIALALVAGGLLVGVALLGDFTPLQAQEGDATQEQGSGTQVGIRLVDLVDRITHTIVHQFTVEVDSLTASAAYEVIVSSDTAALGIDSCGTTSQTQLVTGTASHAFKVIVYACAVDGGTVTAEVRRSGSSTAEASASQGLTVLPIPDYVPAEERPARGATRNVARVGTPGIVQNVQVAERGPTSFKITWSPPAGNGGEPLTGYGLLIWHEDTTQPPYDQAASIGVTDNHTFTGLQPGNTYNFRIHACNGTDSCGWWTAILEATTEPETTPTPGSPTAPHSILSDQVGANSFRVRWSPHAETGGSALTRFGILVRQSGSSWDESRTVWVNANPPHRYSVTGRDPGTTYVVKIKACNGSNDQTSCSAWSSDHRVTTGFTEVNTGTRPVATNPVAPQCPYTTMTKTAWDKPQNLDVTPQESRQITLCWTPVTGASGYTVSATHDPTASSPAYTTVKDIASGSSTNLVIDLDDIYGTTPKVGLGNHKAFGLKVKVEQEVTGTTLESDMIIIIDTPITKATTKDQASGALEVEWNSISSILGTTDSNGEYDLRYRKSKLSYKNWPSTGGTYFEVPSDPEPNASSPQLIESLATNAVYGLQLVFRDFGPSNADDDDTSVFAARHAYAWVSDGAVSDNSRVAGVPVLSRIKGTTYTYKTCESTFDLDGRFGSLGGGTGTWAPLIEEAFRQWQDALSTDLINIEHDTDPCVDYQTVAEAIYERYRDLISQEEEMISYTRKEVLDLIDQFLQTSDQQQIEPGIKEKVDPVYSAHLDQNEIKMYDDVQGIEGYSLPQDVFMEISQYIGHRYECWYKIKRDRLGTVVRNAAGEIQRELDPNVLMCYGEYREAGQPLSGDIWIRRSKFTSDPLAVPSSDAMFNQCGSGNRAGDDNSAYQSFLHEVGHALGIGGDGAGDPEGGHSQLEVASVVNKKAESDCAPHPLDIMALYALYQRR